MSYIDDVRATMETWAPELQAVAQGYMNDREREGFSLSESRLRAWIELRPAAEPVVLNRHHLTEDGEDRPWPRQCMYVGRPFPFCNPFPRNMRISDFMRIVERRWPAALIKKWRARYQESRDRTGLVLDLHRVDLWLALQRDRLTHDALAGVPPNAALVCSCATSPHEEQSNPCHGFTLVRAWRWLRERRDE